METIESAQRPMMSTDFTGTNSEKIDKVVTTIAELRIILQICMVFTGVGFSLMLGLLTFLVVQSFATSSRIDRLSDQLSAETNPVQIMDTFTITLPEDRAHQLRALAAEAGISPEELLKEGVQEWLGRPSQDFAQAAAYVLEKNRELYRRLA